MPLLAFAVLVLIAIIVVLAVHPASPFHSRLRGRNGLDQIPYRTMASLLTPSERSFFGVLSPIAEAEGLRIFAKVRLSDLFHVPKGTRGWLSYHNRIQQKHIDFVLCSRDQVTPVLGIELDDASHGRSSRQERDVFVNAIFDVAGLPLLRVPVRSGYSRQELEKLIHDTLVPAASTAPPLAVPSPEATSTMSMPAVGTNTANKRCPRCGSGLVVRQRRSNGEQFLGCQSYPNCRYTEPMGPPASLASNGNI